MDYLVIGHVTRDRLAEGGFTIGGTAAYAARTANALGCDVRVVTSAEESLDLSDVLPDVEIQRIPASTTTTFENRYSQAGRVQIVRAVAAPLTPGALLASWKGTAVVHLGPVAQEVDPALVDAFPGSFLGITPQGWMRRWDAEGRVLPAPWECAERFLARADAVVLSEEDIGGDAALLARWAAHAPVLVVTRGAAGCTVHTGEKVYDLRGLSVREVDPTGAGDIFAASFFSELAQREHPLEAAQMANCLAGFSVTRSGLSGTPTAKEIARCRTLCG